MEPKKIKISLHGYSQKILIYYPGSILYKKVQLLSENALQSTLFENDEFAALELIQKDRRVRNYLEVKEDISYSILNNDDFTRIELKRQGGKLRKIFIKEVNNGITLFPLFNVQHITKRITGLVIVEKEMGALGHGYILADTFDVNQLQFTASQFDTRLPNGITEIKYNDQSIKLNQAKTLLVGRFALIIN